MMRTKWTKRLLAALLLSCLAAAGLAAVSVHAETPGTGTLVVAENFENRTLSDWHAYFWKDGAAQVELATGDAAITGRQSLKVSAGGEYPFFYGFFNQDMAPKKNQTPYTVCLKIRQTNLERFTVCAGNDPWEDVDASVVYLENGLPAEPFGTTVDTATSIRDEETGIYSVQFTFTKSDKPQCYFWIGGHAKDSAKSSTMTVDEVYLFEGAVAGAGAKVVGRDMEDPELTADNVFEKVSFWADSNYPVEGEGAVNATFDVVKGAEAISGTQSLRVTTPAQYNHAAGFCGFLN